MTVVALEDCTTAVKRIPTNIPTNLFFVKNSRIERILAPATCSRPSLISFIPNKNKPKPPNSRKIVVIPICISLRFSQANLLLFLSSVYKGRYAFARLL